MTPSSVPRAERAALRRDADRFRAELARLLALPVPEDAREAREHARLVSSASRNMSFLAAVSGDLRGTRFLLRRAKALTARISARADVADLEAVEAVLDS